MRVRVCVRVKDPNIGKRIIASIAPSIYGNEQVKTAVALCLVRLNGTFCVALC